MCKLPPHADHAILIALLVGGALYYNKNKDYLAWGAAAGVVSYLYMQKYGHKLPGN